MGGAIYCDEGSSVQITNSTIAGNAAQNVFRNGAGALDIRRGSSCTVVNSIVWGNTSPAILVSADSNATVEFSCVEGETVWPGKGQPEP